MCAILNLEAESSYSCVKPAEKHALIYPFTSFQMKWGVETKVTKTVKTNPPFIRFPDYLEFELKCFTVAVTSVGKTLTVIVKRHTIGIESSRNFYYCHML